MSKHIQTRVWLPALVLILGGVLAGCSDEEGPAEQTGAAIDDAVEQAGEQLDQAGQAAGDAVEQAGDEIEQATDNAN
jgi:hypothetical protein